MRNDIFIPEAVKNTVENTAKVTTVACGRRPIIKYRPLLLWFNFAGKEREF